MIQQKIDCHGYAVFICSGAMKAEAESQILQRGVRQRDVNRLLAWAGGLGTPVLASGLFTVMQFPTELVYINFSSLYCQRVR